MRRIGRETTECMKLSTPFDDIQTVEKCSLNTTKPNGWKCVEKSEKIRMSYCVCFPQIFFIMKNPDLPVFSK